MRLENDDVSEFCRAYLPPVLMVGVWTTVDEAMTPGDAGGGGGGGI